MGNEYLLNALKVAEAISKEAHENQVDKADVNYFVHPFTVSNMLIKGNSKSEILRNIIDNLDDEFILQARVVAYLHDILEDTNVTYNDLYHNNSIPYECTQAVEAITKHSEEVYEDYLNRVKHNKLSSVVKIADMLHNSDLSRLKEISSKDLQRKEKYEKAIEYLSSFECEECRAILPIYKMGNKNTRAGEILCEECLVKYEIHWDEYEDWLKGH